STAADRVQDHRPLQARGRTPPGRASRRRCAGRRHRRGRAPRGPARIARREPGRRPSAARARRRAFSRDEPHAHRRAHRRSRQRPRGAVDGLKARLASRNPNKARELERLLPGWNNEPITETGYPPEDGETYHDNARIKALFGREHAAADEWVIGEDSGLEVEALDGGPGIHSAGSGGDDPVGWLLEQLQGGDTRRARYVSELVLVGPAGEEC